MSFIAVHSEKEFFFALTWLSYLFEMLSVLLQGLGMTNVNIEVKTRIFIKKVVKT